MKRPQRGSTVKQMAYATRMLGGQAVSKKEAALLSGFSMSVAENAKYKIEDTEGYKNALLMLHTRSNNLLNQLLVEFELRGFNEFSNKDLISAVNAISTAWEKIGKTRAAPAMKDPEKNPLRAIFTQRSETRTMVLEPANAPVKVHEAEAAGAPADASPQLKEGDDPMDF